MIVALLAAAGCGGPSRPVVTPVFHQPSAPANGGGAPAAGGNPTSGNPTGGSPKPSATPKPTDGPITVSVALSRLPQFGPPPPAVPIRVPDGPTAKLYFRLPVAAKVAFLTIDDGITQLPGDLALMKAAHIPFTMFLIGPVAKQNPSFFRSLAAEGGVIEDHTLTHPDLKGMPYATQLHEICGARTMLAGTFGSKPRLFRPPYGSYDDTTLRAAHDCGLTAAFDWRETVRNGKVFYQTPTHRIQPGDIILMHFRSTFAADLLAALTAIHQSGLTPALLEDYIDD